MTNKIMRAWRVYGNPGHRQRQAFGESERFDFSEGGSPRIVEIFREDVTGTTEYCVIRITRETAEQCEEELWGQISDGFFENSRVGKVEEVSPLDKDIQII